jgi:hypothetical protein
MIQEAGISEGLCAALIIWQRASHGETKASVLL